MIRNQQPAYNYGLQLLQHQQGPNQAGALGGVERAMQPIVAALLMKKGIAQQEAKDKDYSSALMNYQQGVQNELVPSAVNPTGPVQLGEDPALRDTSGIVQRAAPGEAMANALMGVKNPDVVRDLQPMIMQQQMSDLSRADDRAMANSGMLANQRFQRGQQIGQQDFSAEQAQAGREFTAGQTDKTLAAQTATAEANRQAAAALADANRQSADQRAANSAAATVEAAKIRAGVAQNKPMPQGVQRAEDEDLDAIGLATSLGNDLKAFREKIEGGKLDLGLATNKVSGVRNWLGIGTENSKNFADFKATMEKARNDSLRLNKGVQTEGDAVRAWDELMSNLNDEGVVKQRLQAIEGINARAAQLRAQNVDIRRKRNNQADFDWTGFKIPSSPYAEQGASQLPQGVTEDDIAETMRANNMTREQVLQRLSGGH